LPPGRRRRLRARAPRRGLRRPRRSARRGVRCGRASRLPRPCRPRTAPRSRRAGASFAPARARRRLPGSRAPVRGHRRREGGRMHVGATIRLLRLGAGVGLRDLAERIGVSSAYLSRVENGRDAPPTADRLEAIARELALPPALLLEVAGRVSPFLSSYMREVPAASALFVDIARRNLDADAIARVREV